MMSHDGLLLQRYTEDRDADAFAELVQRHAGMVYGTCLRLTGSPHDAEDAAQECFIDLARNTGAITSSLAGWLHTTALRRAVDAIRHASTRRRHEEQAMTEKGNHAEPTWAELAPSVDQALEELPEELRLPLILHYLQGRNQSEIAAELGVDQSTVSRRVDKGLHDLRERLKKAGVMIPLAALGTLLAENAASAAPATLVAALGKMAMAGAGGAATAGGTAAAGAATSGAATFLLTVTGKIAAALALGVFAAAVVVAYKETTKPKPKAPTQKSVTPQPSGPHRIAPEPQKERKVTKKLDYSKLMLEGRSWVDDSFSMTLQAIARLLGKDADYKTIYALSTNGFAPGIRSDIPCKGTWQMRGRGRCLDLVAGRLGLKVRQLKPPEEPPLPPPGPERGRWVADYKKACAPIIRQALDDGKVVITNSGWDVEVWCSWGVILEAHDDGTILGATQNGRRDNAIDHIAGWGACPPVHYWTVTAGKSTLTPHEADVAMLRRAVRRIRGDREPFLPGKVVFGLAAMDLWMAQMRGLSFQPDCEPDSQDSKGNAGFTALASYEGARLVASYLRERLATFPEAARPHLEATAKHYDQIVEVLRPAITGEGGESYQEFIGDLEKQRIHADKVLGQVKAELKAAAAEIEKALALLKE